MCSRAALLGQGRRGLKISINWTRPEKEERKAFVVDAKQTIDNVIQINGASVSPLLFVVRAIVIVGSWLRSRDGRIGCARKDVGNHHRRNDSARIDREKRILKTVMQEAMGTACRGYRNSSSAGSQGTPLSQFARALAATTCWTFPKLVHCITQRLDKYNSFPLLLYLKLIQRFFSVLRSSFGAFVIESERTGKMKK